MRLPFIGAALLLSACAASRTTIQSSWIDVEYAGPPLDRVPPGPFAGAVAATALAGEEEHPGVRHARVLRLEQNRGKGAAVRAGMLAAAGATRVFVDADLCVGAARHHDREHRRDAEHLQKAQRAVHRGRGREGQGEHPEGEVIPRLAPRPGEVEHVVAADGKARQDRVAVRALGAQVRHAGAEAVAGARRLVPAAGGGRVGEDRRHEDRGQDGGGHGHHRSASAGHPHPAAQDPAGLDDACDA